MPTANAREIFRKNLNKYMSIKNASQADIIAALGVIPSTLSDWVLGKKYPRVDAMQRLADFLEIPMSALTASEDREQPSLTLDELDLIEAYRNADDQSRSYIIDILRAHPRHEKDENSSIRAAIAASEHSGEDGKRRAR